MDLDHHLRRFPQLLRPATFRHRAAALLVAGPSPAPRFVRGRGAAGAGRAGAAWQGLGGENLQKIRKIYGTIVMVNIGLNDDELW